MLVKVKAGQFNRVKSSLMRRFELNMCGLGWRRLVLACLLALLGQFGASAWAQGATNDAFANATPIYGEWGSIAGCNTNATAQAGEPNHAGFAPT